MWEMNLNGATGSYEKVIHDINKIHTEQRHKAINEAYCHDFME
jgi:hypothetical protein